MDPITAFVTLALVMDPVGNVPLFLSVLHTGLWPFPKPVRVPLSCAGSHTPFSDPVSDLVSEPFRTRFWDPLGPHFGLFFGLCSELAA